MASRWKPYRRGIAALLAFGAGFAACLLTGSPPYIAPLSIVVTVLLAWDLGLAAAFGWVCLARILMPAVTSLAGLGVFSVFSQARGAVAVILAWSVVAEMVIAYLTVRFRALHEQLARSKADLLEMNAELQAAVAEVKELRGMLPICAWCKDVRGDVGDWEKIETYIAKNSHATFTHGVCPKCFRKQLASLENGRKAARRN
jgi:hypothetical protein